MPNWTQADLDAAQARLAAGMNKGIPQSPPVVILTPPKAAKKPRGSRLPNKTETQFFQLLEARKRKGDFESVGQWLRSMSIRATIPTGCRFRRRSNYD